MVKILGICGSPRRKSCYKALETALEAAKNAEEGVEVELVELRAKKMNFCIHCNKCLRDKSDRCTVFKDDMTELYDKFYEADGVIIASPVYEMNITAQLCTFFDRFRSAWLKGVEHQKRRPGGHHEFHHQLFPDTGNDGLYRRLRDVFRPHAVESRGRIHGDRGPGRIQKL